MIPGELGVNWMTEHPVMARSRLATAHRYLADALFECSHLLGVIDAHDLFPATVPPREYSLGMERIQSKLLTAVRALDMK